MSFFFTLLLLTCALSAHAKEGPSAVYQGDRGFKTSDLEALLLTTMNVTNKDSSWSIATPACNWKGVGCNSTGSVVTIDWVSVGRQTSQPSPKDSYSWTLTTTSSPGRQTSQPFPKDS